MPLTLVAGHRPATTALRTTCHRRQLLDPNLPPAIRPCPSNAGRSYLPNSAFVTIDRLRRTQHLDPPRSNPHSANLRHGLASPPAVSSLGGFRTPALGVSGTVSHWAGIRKPSQNPTSRAWDDAPGGKAGIPMYARSPEAAVSPDDPSTPAASRYRIVTQRTPP